MPYIKEGSSAMELLEGQIDAFGASNVLAAMREVCFAKAEHLRSNGQDEAVAKRWERVAKVVDMASAKVAVVENGGRVTT